MTAASVTSLGARRTRLSGWQRALSFPVMLCCLLSVLGVLTVRSRFNDPDMWWHLKTGQIIWTTHTIPTKDVFSYTTAHHEWVPHEWLAQTLIFGAYRLGGYPGLMLWLCFSTIALLIAGYMLCTVYSGNAKVAFVGAAVIWFFATVGLAIRPQMIGYILLAIELLLLQLGRRRNPRWFMLLPPLFAVWVNCHGSFFLGLVLAVALLLCSFLDFRSGSLAALPWDRGRRRTLGFALVLSTLALFVNPIGLKQILYPLDTLFAQPIGLSQSAEWMPLTMTSGRGLGLLMVLACIFLLIIVQRSQLFVDELVLLSIGALLAISHQRMLFVFGILTAPLLSRLLSGCWDGYDAERDLPLANTVLIAVSLSVCGWAFPSRENLTQQINNANPVEAVRYMKAHHISGPILNEYVYGGYLIWEAPEYPVFIDGRADVFEWTGVLAQYGSWALLQSSPNTLLDNYGINLCLLSRNSPIAHVMPLVPNWKAVYASDKSIIFVRTSESAK